MAPRKRVAVDTSRLRAMGGEQRIVARPVDSYMRPILREDTTAKQVANALAQVNPEIQRFLNDEREQYRKDQREEGEKNYYESSEEERNDLEQKIRNGEINELQSKFWVEGFSRSLLRNHAREYGDELLITWDQQKDNAGFDFGSFVTARREAYAEANQLSGFRADIFNEEFGAVTERFEAQVQQRNYEHRLQRAREARLESHMGEVGTMLTGWQEQMEAGNWDPAAATTQVNALIQTVMNQGNERRATLDATIGFLEGQALRAARNNQDFEPILQVISGIQLRGSTYGVANADKVERLRNQLITDRDQAEDREFNARLDRDRREAYDLENELEQGLIDNGWSETWWNSEEIRAKRNRLQVLSEQSADTVDRFYITRGEVQRASAPETFRTIAEGIDAGIDQRDAIHTAYENNLLTFTDKQTLLNANANNYSRFVTDNGLENVRTSLEQAIRQNSDPLAGVLSDQTRNAAASRASQDLFRFIQSQIPLVRNGTKTNQQAASDILAEQRRLIEATRDELATAARNTIVTPDGQTVAPSSEEQVSAWNNGVSPWMNAEGTAFNQPLQDVGAMWDAAKVVLERPDQRNSFLTTTDFGRMIAPLVAAGVSQDEIITRFAQDYIRALGGTADASQAVLSPSTTPAQASGNVVTAVESAQVAADDAQQLTTLEGAMRGYNLSPVFSLPENFDPVSRVELTTNNGGFSGSYLYTDANGQRYISTSRVRPRTEGDENLRVTVGDREITVGTEFREALNAVGARNAFIDANDEIPDGFVKAMEIPLNQNGRESIFALFVGEDGRTIITRADRM